MTLINVCPLLVENHSGCVSILQAYLGHHPSLYTWIRNQKPFFQKRSQAGYDCNQLLSVDAPATGG